MPWSPIPKFPEICKELRLDDKYIVNLKTLTKVIMQQTHIIKEKTIGETIKAMVTLDYLKERDGVWEVCNGKPGKFKSDTDKKAKKELVEHAKIEEMIEGKTNDTEEKKVHVAS
jgi:hypothetical protein